VDEPRPEPTAVRATPMPQAPQATPVTDSGRPARP
jgi:hypothetical protein